MTPRICTSSLLFICALVFIQSTFTNATAISNDEYSEETRSHKPHEISSYHLRSHSIEHPTREAGERHSVIHRNRRKHRHGTQPPESDRIQDDLKEKNQHKHKKVHHKDIVYKKKFFDDNPITPSEDPAIKPGCEEGLANCHFKESEVVEEQPKAIGHKRRSRRQAPFEQYRNTWRNANQSPAVSSAYYQVDPCIRLYGYRCGPPQVNPYFSMYNNNWRPYQQQPAVPNYYLPVPYPQQQTWYPAPVQPVTYYRPVVYNPGYPPMNPPLQPYPPALPPQTPRPPTTQTVMPGVVIGGRLGEDFDDDRPSWGAVEVSTLRTITSNDIKPTRRPSPPLRHDRPATTAPPPLPPVIQAGRDISNPPSNNIPEDSGNEEPTACAWAIISCCNPRTNEVRLSCFEGLGCPGPFWDRNPCSKEITKVAINVADRFYN